MKLSVSIPNELNELLEKEMKREDRQRSWVIKKALEEYFERKQKSAPSRQQKTTKETQLPKPKW